jgi:23S rRNA pseudouridine1911/1915/1917 synthase
MIYRELSAGEFADLSSRILYEDNHLLIVNKKVGEIVQGDKTGDEPLSDTYKAFIAMRDSKPGQVFLGLPHRLDRPVSGITVLAKTSKALERLNAMFRDSQVHKFYWAMVCAEPDSSEGLLEDMLWRDERQNKSFVCRPGAARRDAKMARLRYMRLGRTDRYVVLEVELMTGRHHQIRCQLSHMGCPIKGDLKYGAPRSNPDGGISLHARRISFLHPVKKEQVTVEAPVPASWKGVADCFCCV